MLYLHKIQNSQGEWINNQLDMIEETIRFFQHQFTEDCYLDDFRILNHIREKTIVDHITFLTCMIKKRSKHQYLLDQMILQEFFLFS